MINPAGKISDIHFLTQLTPEEKQVMLKDPSMGTGQPWRSGVFEQHDLMLCAATYTDADSTSSHSLLSWPLRLPCANCV